jgi:DNA repair exonuclease SbcCD ATPase subunit
MSYYTAIVTPILNDYLHWDGRRAAYAALIQEVEQDPNWVDEEDPNYTREEKLQGCYDALMEAEEQVADLDAQIQAALQAAHEQNSALQAQLNQLQAAG